jgi:hypothetical protein
MDTPFTITEEHRICPTCGQPCKADKKDFRTDSLWTLQILSVAGKGMTSRDVAEEKMKAGYPAIMAKDAARHLPQIRFWGLVEYTGEKRECCKVYCITQKGRDFIAGAVPVPSFVWVYNNERISPPHGTDEGDPIFWSSVREKNKDQELADRMSYWESSIGMLPSTP